PGGKQHCDVNSFRVHRLELDFAGPTTRRVIAVDALVLFVVVSSVRGAASAQGGRVGVRKDQAQVADILGCSATWGVEAELRGDITLPKVGRLHNVHVAIKDFESVFSHVLLRFRQAIASVMLLFERNAAKHRVSSLESEFRATSYSADIRRTP